MALPSLPRGTLSRFGETLKATIEHELDKLSEEASTADELRDSLQRRIRAVSKNTGYILFAVRTGDVSNLESLILQNQSILLEALSASSSDSSRREGFLGQAIEKYTETRLLQHFFSTGKLASQSELQPCNDEEYIGASLGFAQEIARYVIGRACEDDVTSISICQTLCSQLNGKMLEFNFRNGPLRRKYDGLKYALRTMENTLYELSLVAKDPLLPGNEGEEVPKKKMKPDCENVAATESLNAPQARPSEEPTLAAEPSLIDLPDLESIRGRMEALDALREDVIKQSRDIQKLSKQAIYSVQRNALSDAKAKLNKALTTATAIIGVVKENPTLRSGAFSNSLEEWAEGMMCLEWVQSKRLLTKAQLAIVDSHEYIGALSDFTGEIGRIAVAKASQRDLAAVEEVHQAALVVCHAIMQLNISGKYSSKFGAAATNLRKVEDIVYDLHLLHKGGRAGRIKEQPPREDLGGKGESAAGNGEDA